MVYIVATMKSNQRTVKVYDTTHTTLGKLSQKYRISMAAIVDALVAKMASDPRFTLEIPPVDFRYEKSNAKRIRKQSGKGAK